MYGGESQSSLGLMRYLCTQFKYGLTNYLQKRGSYSTTERKIFKSIGKDESGEDRMPSTGCRRHDTRHGDACPVRHQSLFGLHVT